MLNRHAEVSIGRPESGGVKLLAQLQVWLDPRRSLAARLLFGLFLAFLIPGAVFVLLLQRRVRDLHDSSLQRCAAVRRVQSSIQLKQDASLRAEWIERRVAAVEEGAWSLAAATRLALTAPLDISG